MPNPNAIPAPLPGLVGRWVFVPMPEDAEMGLTGQIETSLGDYHLIRMRGHSGCPSRLLSSDTLCGEFVYIFDTEAQLDAWVESEPAGSPPRVVPFRKPE
jgi:hypothetical protein